MGDISQDDVDASTKLAKLAERDHEVNKFTLLRAIRVDGDIVIVLRSADVAVLRTNNALVEKIETEFSQKVWFVESEATDRRFIEGLFQPIRVLSVNLFWLPDGNKLTKVVAAGSVARSRLNLEKVLKVAKAARNMELVVEFEQR